MKKWGRLGAYGGTLLAAGLLAALVFVGGSSGANSASYPDPSGDAANAADVTSVVISNDDAGQLTFELSFSNRPTFTAGAVNLYLDSDGNSGTGAAGSDYLLRYWASDPQPYALARWNGASFAPVAAPSFSYITAPNRITYSVNRSDIGTTTSLNFYVLTSDGGNDYVPDSAVSGARASYTVIVGPGTTTTLPPTTTQPQPPPTQPPPPTTTAAPPQPPSPTTTATTTATIAELPDSDGDKVPNARDACPTKAAGKWDPNGNGCAGPFSAINARVSFQLRIPPLQFTQLRVRGVPFKGAVDLRLQGVRERLTGSGSVSSRKLVGDPIDEGAVLELRVSKSGWIGYYARLRVSSNGVTLITRRCLPPQGGNSPVPCGASLRGK